MYLNLIVGINKKGGIGFNGSMPWYFPEDLKYFQKVTKETKDPNKMNAVIMGRNTMNSIPKFPLKNRLNVCISTTQTTHNNDSVLFYKSLDLAIDDLKQNKNIEKLFIIGGSMLYDACIEHKDFKYLYLNNLNDSSECDVFFPKINMTDYILKEQQLLSSNVTANVYEKIY